MNRDKVRSIKIGLISILSIYSFGVLADNAPVIDATKGHQNQNNNVVVPRPVVPSTTVNPVNSYNSYQEASSTSSDIKELRGKLEVQQHQLELLTAEQKDLRQQISSLNTKISAQGDELTRLKASTQDNSKSEFKVTTSSSKPLSSGQVKTNGSTGLDDEKAYALATTQIKNKEYKSATSSLIDFFKYLL